MTKLIKAIRDFDEEFQPAGLKIFYRVGSDVRTLLLSAADIEGLSAAEIRALAQSLADADTGLAGDIGEVETIVPSPIQEARRWFRDHSAVRAFFEQDTSAIDSNIDVANTAQLKEIIKGCVIIARAYGLLEIAD
jgi:hypothetical protein